MIDLAAVEAAAVIVGGRFRRTELIHSHYFSDRTGIPLYFKCENLQRTGSFKVRGAGHFLLRQAPEDLARGVVTASAGNHAQGVALSASSLGVTAQVVMPESTPLAKVQATRHYGARVLLHGSCFDEALAEARRLEREEGLLYVPPFDDPLVMAGQGTVALEVLEDLPEVDTLVVPIGGGGLISGIATVVKARRPRARVIGVEAAGAASALESRKRGALTAVAEAHSLADGIALKCIGKQTFPVIERLVDDIVTVTEEEIAQAIVSLLEKGRLVVEGAGAVSLAAVLYGGRRLARGATVCVLSGGNIDVQAMDRVIERGMVAEGRYLKVRVDLNDVPSELARLVGLLAELGANIFHVRHDRRNVELPLGRAALHLELETRGPEHIGEVLAALRGAGFRVTQVAGRGAKTPTVY